MAFAGGGPGDPGEPSQPAPPPMAVFDLKQQGIYALSVTCDPKPEDCNAALMQQLNRLSIVDAHAPYGVWVTLASKSPSGFIDAFYAAQIGPGSSDVTAAPRPGSHTGLISYISFKIDAASGALIGVALDLQ